MTRGLVLFEWPNQILEEGVGKRCSECGLGPVAPLIIMGHRSAVPKSQNTFCPKCRIKQINK